MEKIDYKKHFKALYQPKSKPELIAIPNMIFLSIQGQGDPNEAEFAQVTQALYGLSYAVKMSYKNEVPPQNYYPYTVFPLEGEWDLVDKTKSHTDKSNYAYTLMMRQPDFLTTEVWESLRQVAMAKKGNALMAEVKFGAYEEGLCCQMMHIGSFDEEPESFRQMEAFCEAQGYQRASKRHREIYLSDPRKTAPEKLKTILRFKVSKMD